MYGSKKVYTTKYIQTLKISVISVISNDNKKITKTSRSIKTKKYGMEEYGTKDFLYLEEYFFWMHLEWNKVQLNAL